MTSKYNLVKQIMSLILQKGDLILSQTHPYGHPFSRFCAFLIDSLLIGLVGAGIDLSLGLPGGISVEALAAQTGLPSYLKLAFHFLYWPIFESSRLQATPGKMLLKLQVTDLAGQRISIGRALVRNVSKVLSLLPFGFGFMMVGITLRNQCLHDKIAKTLVVKKVKGEKLATNS